MLKPGVYPLRNVQIVVVADDYGRGRVILKASVGDEERQYTIATYEPPETNCLEEFKRLAAKVLYAKLPGQDADDLLSSIEEEHGPGFWFSRYTEGDSFKTQQLSDDLNEYLRTGEWPERD